jgi:hypothetical protein
MSAPAWPWIALVVVGFMVCLLMLAGTRRVIRRLRCPERGRDVVLHVQEAIWDGRPVDVECCSAFTPPAAVRCSKTCLRSLA